MASNVDWQMMGVVGNWFHVCSVVLNMFRNKLQYLRKTILKHYCWSLFPKFCTKTGEIAKIR